MHDSRVTKYGKIIITYQASNYKFSAREHVRADGTSKNFLGLQSNILV